MKNNCNKYIHFKDNHKKDDPNQDKNEKNKKKKISCSFEFFVLVLLTANFYKLMVCNMSSILSKAKYKLSLKTSNKNNLDNEYLGF